MCIVAVSAACWGYSDKLCVCSSSDVDVSCTVQGSWIFSTKWWLPLQMFTFLLAVLGSVNHQVRHGGLQVLWRCNIAQQEPAALKSNQKCFDTCHEGAASRSCYCQPHVRVLGLQEDPGVHQ